MHQNQITKRVIIINQKTNVLSEKQDSINACNSNSNALSNYNTLNESSHYYKIFPQKNQQINKDFIKELNTIFKQNNQKVQELKEVVVSLKERTHKIENEIKEFELCQKKRRNRRKSKEIEKKHQCNKCQKLYGSEISLNLHQRLKHLM